VVLAKRLSGESDLTSALRDYESQRTRRVAVIVQRSRRAARWPNSRPALVPAARRPTHEDARSGAAKASRGDIGLRNLR
jgi:hypothetical protein